MPRLGPVDLTTMIGKARTLLDTVKSKLGMIPTMLRTMALSSAVREDSVGLNTALAGAAFHARMPDQFVPVVAEVNRCGYCLAAHSDFGKQAGLDAGALERARQAARDPRAVTALRIVRIISPSLHESVSYPSSTGDSRRQLFHAPSSGHPGSPVLTIRS